MATSTGTTKAGSGANASDAETAEPVKGGPKAGAEEQQAERQGESSGTVKYVGDAGVREISKADWKAAGLEHDTVTWNADNEYTVLKSVFSADALEILRRDRGLKISS